MRAPILVLLAAMIASLATLIAPAPASAEDTLIISRSDLQVLIAGREPAVDLPAGSGRLSLKDGVPTLDKVATSLVPFICTQIIYGPDSPWADICSSRMHIEGGILLSSPNPSALINLDAFNKSALELVCGPFACGDLLPICGASQRYDAASNSCVPFKPVTLCQASDQGCLSKEVLALLGRIPDCRVAICLPEDMLKLVQQNLPDFAQGPVQRAVAAGLTGISIKDADFTDKVANLGAGQALLLQP